MTKHQLYESCSTCFTVFDAEIHEKIRLWIGISCILSVVVVLLFVNHDDFIGIAAILALLARSVILLRHQNREGLGSLGVRGMSRNEQKRRSVDAAQHIDLIRMLNLMNDLDVSRCSRIRIATYCAALSTNGINA